MRLLTSTQNFENRDFREIAESDGVPRRSGLSLRTGDNDRVVDVFVQTDCVREPGSSGGDSGENREISIGRLGGGMYTERCSRNLDVEECP